MYKNVTQPKLLSWRLFGQALLLSIVAPLVSFPLWLLWFNRPSEIARFDPSDWVIIFQLEYLGYSISMPLWVYFSLYALNLLAAHGAGSMNFLERHRILKWILLLCVSTVAFSAGLIWGVENSSGRPY